MKPLLTLSVLFCLLSFNANAQKWLWARQNYGTASYEEGIAVATDKNDNGYLTGYMPEGDAIFGKDTISCFGVGIVVGFLVKYDSSGNCLWAKQSNGYSVPYSITTDGNNNICEAGVFIDTTFFGSFRVTTKNQNVYIVKYDANGNVLWAKSPVASATNYSTCFSVATDIENNFYITGSYRDTIVFGTFTLISNGILNTYLIKYDPNGNVIWARSFGGNGANGDVANVVTVDKENDPIITGSFSTASLTFASNTLTNNCQNTAFIAKYSSIGIPLWAVASISSGNASDYGNCITTDKTNNIYVSGSFNDNNIAFGKDTLNITQGPLFIAKYDSLGNELWAKSGKSGFAGTVSYSIVTDMCNDVYIGGGCGDSAGDILTIDNVTYSVPANSSDPSFIIELDSLGNILNGVMTPSGGDDWNAIALDNQNNIYFGGDIEMDMFLGDSVFCPNDETAFLAKLSFGQPSCCKNTNEFILSKPYLNSDSTLLTVTPIGTSYLWSNGATTSNIVVITAATYSVRVTDENGCSHMASIEITENCGTIFVPNAFSPNGDGQNDILYVRGDCIQTMQFEIFDRWGNKVFETDNQSVGWNGTYHGQGMNTGVFVYELTATEYGGKTYTKKGNVTLVR